MNIDDIRSQYPHPITGQQASYPYQEGEYCIGGAYCMAVGFRMQDLRFPTRQELARIMSTHIAGLNYERALAYATDITCANDVGDFEDAWMVLDEALTSLVDQHAHERGASPGAGSRNLVAPRTY